MKMILITLFIFVQNIKKKKTHTHTDIEKEINLHIHHITLLLSFISFNLSHASISFLLINLLKIKKIKQQQQ